MVALDVRKTQLVGVAPCGYPRSKKNKLILASQKSATSEISLIISSQKSANGADYTSLGHRPRKASPPQKRAESPHHNPTANRARHQLAAPAPDHRTSRSRPSLTNPKRCFEGRKDNVKPHLNPVIVPSKSHFVARLSSLVKIPLRPHTAKTSARETQNEYHARQQVVVSVMSTTTAKEWLVTGNPCKKTAEIWGLSCPSDSPKKFSTRGKEIQELSYAQS